MPQAASARLVDATQICEEFSTHPSRISEWYRDRATTGFPEVHRTEGRKRFWEHGVVAAFFAVQAEARTGRTLPASVLDADQDELLSAAQVSQLAGFTNPTTIYWYLKNLPGYFPAPDVSIDTMQWRRGTIVAWIGQRPGKGRRSGAVRQANPLPAVPADGDPDEFLGVPQVAALLGYSSVPSFSSALSQGNLPDLAEPDHLAPGLRGRPVKQWRRSTILAAAQRRGRSTSTSRPAGAEELLGAAEAATMLGYSSAASFNGALNRGRLPELEQPDALEAQPGGRGRAQKKWTRSRLEQVAADRTAP